MEFCLDLNWGGVSDFRHGFFVKGRGFWHFGKLNDQKGTRKIRAPALGTRYTRYNRALAVGTILYMKYCMFFRQKLAD